MADQGVLFNPDTMQYAVPDEGAEGGYRIVPQHIYEMGGLESAMVGAGKTFTDIGRGVRDLFGSETAQAEQAEAEQLFAPLAQEQGAATMIGQALPYLATAPLAGAGIGANAALAGGTGFLRQTGSMSERAQAGGIEGLLGGAGAGLGNLAGRAVNRLRGAFDDTIAGQFAARGGKVTPGQASGSNALRQAEGPLESAGVLDYQADANNQLIADKLGRAIGQDVTDLSEAGLGDAAEAIGARMDDALAGLDVKLDEGMVAKLNTALGDNPYLNLPEDRINLDAKKYQQLRRSLTDIMRTEGRSASPTAGKMEYIGDLVDDLDEKFIQTAGPEKAQALRTAREQYRTLIAAEKGRAVTPDGFVNAQTLQTNLRRTYPSARRGRYGRNLPETQDLLETVSLKNSRALSAKQPNSGTASRLALGLGPGALGGYAGYQSTGPEGALIGALLGATMGRNYGALGQLMAGKAPSALLPGAGRAIGQAIGAQDGTE